MTIHVVPEAAPAPAKSRDRAAYLADLVSRTRHAESHVAAVAELRDRAATLLSEQAWPSTRQEDWRFTDMSALLDIELAAAAPASGSADLIQTVALGEATTRLVIVNGRYVPELSTTGELPPGTILANLSDLTGDRYPAEFGQVAQLAETFAALNTTGFIDAVVLRIPRHQTVTAPIHVIYVASGDQASLIQPRLLAIAETNASLTLVEDFISEGDTVHLTNSVTEIVLGDNAQIHHDRVQRLALTQYHISTTAVRQARDSRYTGTDIEFGAGISRHHADVQHTGVQTETNLYSLAVVNGHQVADTHSAIAHAHPYGTTNQLHKCIVDDAAHTVFNGKILVPHAAQQTNASQLNRNLLLSSKARVDTKPQLEIVADNVKCAHGATISQLEADEVFYLQSRGINQDQAKRLLIYAFAQEVIHQISVPSLQAALTRWVTDHTQAAPR